MSISGRFGSSRRLSELSTISVGSTDGDTGENQDLAAIRKAAHQIGSLAGQLLAFSREQPDRPAVSLDLNRLIDDSRDLLQLLAGKEVRIKMHLAPDLHLVEAIPAGLPRCWLAWRPTRNARRSVAGH